MKLKDYIEILQTFDPNAEVLKQEKKLYGRKVLIPLEKRDIIPPHVHFKYNSTTGHETLVDSFVV